MARGSALRKLRITILLYILLMVAAATWLSRVWTTDWDEPLWMAVYPVNGDQSEQSQRYIERLDIDIFVPVERFLEREARKFGLPLERPLRIDLRGQVDEKPAPPPLDRNPLKVMAWSLKLRYWAYRMQRAQGGPAPDIRVFVIYHDPDRHSVLGHSLGLQKGLIGVVNAFASRSLASQNNVIIAHELLHTLGATDKYDVSSNIPLYPGGFADPEQVPLYPQRRAEIMGGRIPVTAHEAAIPSSLKHVVIGPVTALEIRWIE